MIDIKRLSQNKWKDYQRIRLEALESDPIAFGSSYTEEKEFGAEVWKNRIGNTLFALIENKPIGMVGYLFNNKPSNKHVASIFGMYVSKEYRNRGVGFQLLNNVMLSIKENKDIRKIKLSVNPRQIYAVKLYRKYGFNSTGRSKDEYFIEGRFYDELLMEKLI